MRTIIFVILATLLSFHAYAQANINTKKTNLLFTEYKIVKDYAVIYFNIINLPEEKINDLNKELKKHKDIFFSRIYTSIDNQTHCQIKSKNTDIKPEEILSILKKFGADFAYTSVRKK